MTNTALEDQYVYKERERDRRATDMKTSIFSSSDGFEGGVYARSSGMEA